MMLVTTRTCAWDICSEWCASPGRDENDGAISQQAGDMRNESQHAFAHRPCG
jgi:hypothetical protein